MMRHFHANRRAVLRDLVAGLTSALVYVPKGMALALVAGVNPIHGLYTGVVASLVGALLAGSSYMVIVATNELAVPTGQILAGIGGDAAITMLLTLTLLVGVIQLAFGLFKLGSIVRFISESVMTGFVTGVAVLLVVSQLDKLTGYHSQVSGNALTKAWDWLNHLHRIDAASSIIGVGTIAAIVALQRTPLRKLAFILAIVAAGVVAVLWREPSVALVGAIPIELPSIEMPKWASIPQLFVPALSLAIIGLCVSAGVGQSYPERDGSVPDTSRDFIGQGAANIAAGLVQGIPAGGSFSQTAVAVGAGARTRIATVCFAIVLVVCLLAIGKLVAYIPTAALAALLVVVGVEMVSPQRMARVRGTNWSERAAMILTFALTLTIPLQYAILAGVALTIALYVYSSSMTMRIVTIVPLGAGRYEERAAPREIPSHQTTILGVHGNSFFAAVYSFERNLPAIDNTKNAVVIFLMRGRDTISSSFLAFLERYAKKVRSGGNELMLSGVEPKVKQELERSGTIKIVGEENVFITTAIIGDALASAERAADEWLKGRVGKT